MDSKNTAQSILESLTSLFSNEDEVRAYMEDKSGWIHDHGLEDASYEEITEAVTIAFDMPVVNQGAVVNGGNATATIGTSAPAPAAPAATAPAPAAAAPAPLVLPPPPPMPPASMPPAEAVEQVINHYVTHVYETTNVDDR
ncbi:MAG: hypothetical protein KDB40_06395, partial [Acidimicrobiales bacterium]|nr:hypothetical protein [Acidimicrobiales bacterium]